MKIACLCHRLPDRDIRAAVAAGSERPALPTTLQRATA